MKKPDLSRFELRDEPYYSDTSVSTIAEHYLNYFAEEGLAATISELDGFEGVWDPAGHAKFTLGYHPLGLLALELWGAGDLRRPAQTNEVLPPPLAEAKDWEIRRHTKLLASFCITDFNKTYYLPSNVFIPPQPLKPSRFAGKAEQVKYQEALRAYEEKIRLLEARQSEEAVLHESVVRDGSMQKCIDYTETLEPLLYTIGGNDKMQSTFEKGQVVFTSSEQAYRVEGSTEQVLARLAFMLPNNDGQPDSTYTTSFFARPEAALKTAYLPLTKRDASEAMKQLMPVVEERYPRKMENAITLAISELDEGSRSDVIEAMNTSERAYPPEKTTKVGCVLVGQDKRFTGANLKRAGWKKTTHAEEIAINSAHMSGIHKIDKVFLYGTTDKPCSPCGSCTDMLLENDPEGSTLIYMIARDGESVTIARLRDLQPFSFKG